MYSINMNSAPGIQDCRLFGPRWSRAATGSSPPQYFDVFSAGKFPTMFIISFGGTSN